jgi:hypothetical protein
MTNEDTISIFQNTNIGKYVKVGLYYGNNKKTISNGDSSITLPATFEYGKHNWRFTKMTYVYAHL